MSKPEPLPDCTCHYSGKGPRLHADDCARFIALVERYPGKNLGLKVVKGRVVRAT